MALDVAVPPEERALAIAVPLERPPARLVADDHPRKHLLEAQLEERVPGGELDALGGATLAPLVALADHVAELGVMVAPRDPVQADVADQPAVGGAHHRPEHVVRARRHLLEPLLLLPERG